MLPVAKSRLLDCEQKGYRQLLRCDFEGMSLPPSRSSSPYPTSWNVTVLMENAAPVLDHEMQTIC